MARVLLLTIVLGSVAISGEAPPPSRPVIGDLKSPASVAIGLAGRTFVTTADGVLRVSDGKAAPFAAGMSDPSGIAGYNEWLFVADKDRIWRLDAKGKAEKFVDAAAFPTPPRSLDDLVVDPESGLLYVTDVGDQEGNGAAIFRIGPKAKVDLLLDAKKFPKLGVPRGLVLDGASNLIFTDVRTGELRRLHLANGSTELLAEGLGAPEGLAWDHFGRLVIGDSKGGRLWVIPRPGTKPVVMAEGLSGVGDLCLDPATQSMLVVERKAGKLTTVPITTPGLNVDESALPLRAELAFPNLQWTGWQDVTAAGKVNPLRGIVLTHAGDGSDRVFMATQHGVIHVFPNEQTATQSKIFLDIQERVSYRDDQNEEGFLGLAFHPKFKDNGELFIFYTPKKTRLTNVVSRFRLRKDDPTQADPESEEELLRFTKPFWNHDGGTLCFGPDGNLYVTHGDGGAANDPFDNGQKLSTHLGKVLRIDVDHKDAGKNYAIPKDNPFVDRPEVKPEIWAYGLRNIWRMAFDRETGQLWAADVGQNLYEEINLITRGGNYGWNRREGLHPFGPKGVGPRPEFIEPIWEYHHDLGKSITGGLVYRGRRLPELQGHYLYGDYVSGRIWALKYDPAQGRVVANRPIAEKGVHIHSFGEDERGEVYFLTAAATGKCIYQLTR